MTGDIETRFYCEMKRSVEEFHDIEVSFLALIHRSRIHMLLYLLMTQLYNVINY